MKSIIKKFFVIIMIICILFPMLFSNVSKATDKLILTTERAGNYVATFAINFFNNWSSVSYVKKSDSSSANGTSNSSYRVPLDEGSFYYNRGIRINDKHYGQDYSAPAGTTIYSICSGIVKDVGYEPDRNTGRGNYVVVTDNNGFDIEYMHMYETPYVNKGETVGTDTILGIVGDTGYSRGNHLHLDIFTSDSSYYEKIGDKTVTYEENAGVLEQPIIAYRADYGGRYYICPRYYIENNGNLLGGSTSGTSHTSSTSVIERGIIKTAYDDTADEKTNPIKPGDEQYVLSNKSWIDFVFRNALSLENRINVETQEDDMDYSKDSTQYYPSSNYDSNIYFEKIGESNLTKDGLIDITELMNSGKVLPGDILYTTEHEYLLYVGGTKVIYAQEPYGEEGALKYEYLQNYLIKVKNKLTNRIKEQIPENQREDAEIQLPAYGITDIYRVTQTLINEVPVYEDTQNLFFNNKGYYDPNTEYSGIPVHGSYNGSTHQSLFKWIINAIADIFWFLINLIFYILRMVIVGWVSIFESLIQSIVLKLSGNTAQLPLVDKFTGLSATAYSGDIVTVESIFFNQLPITDANFFNFESAGGHLLTDSNGNPTMLYILKQNLAIWYTIVRNFSIGIMLFMLLYIGIRMAFTTVAEKKADYKKSLINWVQAFAIVMFIHFFMYGVFYLNDNLVEILHKLTQIFATNILGGGMTEVSLYDAIRTKAYAFDFLEGTAGLVFYIIIIYLLLRFLLIYLKRAIAIYVLGMMGSFMGVKYAFDKANGKKTTSLGKWMKDFAFNVLLQSIHCLIYTVLMTVALSTASTSIAGLIISIVILQFMIQSDKIFMKIFGINAKGGLLEDVDKPESYFTLLAKAKIITTGAEKVFNYGKNTLKGESEVGKWYQMAKYADANDDLKKAQKKVEMAKYNKIGKRAQKLDKIARHRLLPIGLLQRFTSTDIQRMKRLLAENSTLEAKTKIYGNIQKQKKLKKQHYTRNLNSTKNLATGAFKTIAGVGLLVEGFAPAAHSMQAGISTIDKEFDRKTAKTYRRTRTDEKYLPGILGDLQIKEQIENEKYNKEMKKLEGKQNALELLTVYESDTNKILDELIRKGKNEDRLGEILRDFKQTASRTKKSNVSIDKIKKAVDRYMYRNDKQVLNDSDFDSLMNELQEILDEKDSNIINLDEDTRNRLRASFTGSLDGLESKEASALIVESINKPDVIDIGRLNRATDAEIQNKLKRISNNLKYMYGINQKSKIENKGAADDYTKVVKEFIKKLEEVE